MTSRAGKEGTPVPVLAAIMILATPTIAVACESNGTDPVMIRQDIHPAPTARVVRAESPRNPLDRNSTECRTLASRLQIAAQYRQAPETFARGSGNRPSGCEPGQATCGRAWVDEDGFMVVAYPENGAPGVSFLFHLELTSWATCDTLSLRARSSPRGVDLCGPIMRGALQGMWVLIDRTCHETRIIVADDAYIGFDSDYDVLSRCEDLDLGRRQAPVGAAQHLRCANLREAIINTVP
jgi:hypothetical protein